MRILLVSYYFPPFNSVGAVRPGKLAAYLAAQGHDVQVLTCSNQPFPQGQALELDAGRVTAVQAWSVNAPVEWLRGGRSKVAREGFGGDTGGGMGRLGKLYKTLLHWPDAQLGWVRAAVRAGQQLLASGRYDLIYASAPPFSGLRVAAALSRAARVPWVAELRDLWTDNHSYAFPAWRRAIESRWEKRLLSSAAALVTVSAPLAGKLQRFGKPVWEVRNGCDPEDFTGLERPAGLSSEQDVLNIVFTGNVYGGHYDVEMFCEGLRQYVAGGGRTQVHVVGRNTGALKAAAHASGTEHAFRFEGTVQRAQALALQRHTDVLLFFLWPGEHGNGVFSAKLFEYAGAGRPVLAVGPGGSDVAQLIDAAGLGCVCPSAQTVAAQLSAWQQAKRVQGMLASAKQPGYDLSRSTQFQALEGHLQGLVPVGGL